MSPTTASVDADLPLSGITVVALEQAVAAPLATRHLADMGARVIKIERPGRGDFARHYDGAVRGLAAHFVWLNRGKESVAIDVKTPAGRGAVRRLVAGADVFVQNLAPGAAGRLGLSAERLRVDPLRADPLRAEEGRAGDSRAGDSRAGDSRAGELITVDLSGYGDGGPFSGRKAYDMLVQAEAGVVSITGGPDTPAKAGIPAADIAAGMYAFSGTMAALLRRERTGQGAHVTVSMLDALTEWMGYPMYTAMYGGGTIPRTGVAHTAIVPYNAYPCTDGQVLIGVQNEDQWAALCTRLIGRPELAEDDRYATNIDRVQRRAEVDALVAGSTRDHAAVGLLALLIEAGIPAAQLRDVPGMIGHPQLAHRNRWRSVDTPAGPVDAVLPPIGIAGAEPAMGEVPALGQHTDSVLAGLGLDDAEIRALRDEGTVQ